MNDVFDWICVMFCAICGWFWGGMDNFYYTLLTFLFIDHVAGQLDARLENRHSRKDVIKDLAKKNHDCYFSWNRKYYRQYLI